MNKKDWDKLIELSYTGGFLFKPANQNAMELCNMSKIGESHLFGLKTPRDAKLHQCYFVLLKFIWGYMPDNFQAKVPSESFYLWLKHLKKEYEVKFSFIDEQKQEDIASFCLDLGLSTDDAAKIAVKFGKTDLIEYESISFGRMSNETFKNYVKEQLPFIYENVLGKYYKGEDYNNIIETIEQEFEKFLAKLES
jgi:DNA polymerase I-like protein with 3'-5' exonuclease and polymerase domains